MSNKANTGEASRQFSELAQGTQVAALRDAIESLIKSGFNPESEAIRVLENALMPIPMAQKINEALEKIGLQAAEVKATVCGYSGFERTTYIIAAVELSPTSCGSKPQASHQASPLKNHHVKQEQLRTSSSR